MILPDEKQTYHLRDIATILIANFDNAVGDLHYPPSKIIFHVLLKGAKKRDQ